MEQFRQEMVDGDETTGVKDEDGRLRMTTVEDRRQQSFEDIQFQTELRGRKMFGGHQ